MARRVRMKLTLEGPTGLVKKRLLDALRDAGYTVEESSTSSGTLVIKATVLAPHGEVS